MVKLLEEIILGALNEHTFTYSEYVVCLRDIIEGYLLSLPNEYSPNSSPNQQHE